jgi:hypothetical protein
MSDKTLEYPGFPKLADPKQAGEVKVVNSPQELSEAQARLNISNDNQAYGGTKPTANFAYVKGAALSPKRTHIKRDPNLAASHQAHEKFHLYMNQIERMHGRKARLNLAENLYKSIPEESRKELDVFVRRRFPKGTAEGFPMWHEERIAGLLNYMNSDSEKAAEFSHRNGWDPQSRAAHLVIGHANGKSATEVDTWDAQRQAAFHEKVGQFKDLHQKLHVAFLSLQRASKKADKSWLSKRVPVELKKSEESPLSLSDTEQEALSALVDKFDTDGPEFKTASFMANGYEPTQEDLELAILEHEADPDGIALMSHKLPVTDDNKKRLRLLITAQKGSKLKKSEGSSPRAQVQPFDYQAAGFAAKAKEAFLNGKVKKVELGGKHSAGSALFKDADYKTWFLKPGSGGVSSAKGVVEEKASASRREVAFNLIAQMCGMQDFVPKSALLLIDGRETAMLEFFDGQYRPINKIRKEHKIETIFEPYIANAVIHKCAVLDYLMGNTDRHAGNVLSDMENFKLIDAGSAFAGNSFSPLDPKTFIPIYLRAFSGRDFKVLTPQERFEFMPKLSDSQEPILLNWLQNIPVGAILHLMHRYGLNSDPFMTRYNKMMSYPGKKSEFITKFWAGVTV